MDAIVKMGRVLAAIETLDTTLRLKPAHPLLWSGSVHASLIKGGRELSSYPEQCILSVERRTIPGDTPRTAKEELAGIVGELEAADPSFQAVVRRGLDRSPLETPDDADIAISVRRAAESVLGKNRRSPASLSGRTRRCSQRGAFPHCCSDPRARGRMPLRSGWTWRVCGSAPRCIFARPPNSVHDGGIILAAC